MIDFAALYEKVKKFKKEPYRDQSKTAAPIKGPNQDQSGVGVSHDVADYTISDGFISGVSAHAGRAPQIAQRKGAMGKTLNAPASAASLRNASVRTNVQLDKIDQNNDEKQVKNKEEKIAGRKQAEKQRKTSTNPTKVNQMSESKTYMTFKDFVKVSESNIAEATRAAIAKTAAKNAARDAGVKMPTPKKPAKENPIKLREDEQVDEAKKPVEDEPDVSAGSGKFAVDLRKRPIGDYHTLTFADNKTHKVHTQHVAKANKMMANAPRPSDKEDIQNSLHHSHDRFMQTVNTGKAIKDPKRGISLGGSAKINGSKE